MKFKESLPYKNKILLYVVLPVLLFSIACFFILEQYYYFIIYLIIVIILGYFFLFTFYIVNDDYLIIQVGFFKIKIKYQDIVSVIEDNEKIKVSTKKFNYVFCPDKKDEFKEVFKSRLNKDISYTVIEKGE